MCGIIGYIGNKSAQDIIVKGLKRLEYRGYDSAGIATMEANKLVVTKTSGKVTDLISSIPNDRHKGNIGIGHTRWATHGEPNSKNAHPHFDESRKFTLVHNGIIENSNSLKQLLFDNGIKCQTETDTEVLVQFIAYLYEMKKLSF